MKVYQDTKKLEQLSENLYQQYGKPLEKGHKGEFLAVSFKGKTILGQDLLEIAERVVENFGPANSFIFKIGDMSVWKWR